MVLLLLYQFEDVGVGPGAHSRFFLHDKVLREARVQSLDPKLWQEIVSRNGHATQVRREQSSLEILTELLMTSLRSTKGLQQSRYFQQHTLMLSLVHN